MPSTNCTKRTLAMVAKPRVLTEGKFRQVRKMMAAVHHRCKRLIRISIEDLELGQLEPGHVKEIAEKEFFEKLNIAYK